MHDVDVGIGSGGVGQESVGEAIGMLVIDCESVENVVGHEVSEIDLNGGVRLLPCHPCGCVQFVRGLHGAGVRRVGPHFEDVFV